MLILFNDCGFPTHASRAAWLSHKFHREIHYLDELSMHEGHLVIDKLKEIREDQKS